MAMEEMGSRIVGDYKIGPNKIGSGSFSDVWMGHHHRDGVEVAVKEIDKRKLSSKVKGSLLKEITILRQVSHPNIVKLHQAIQTEDKIYHILEYCTGGDLAAYIHLHGRVSESVARHFMRQIEDKIYHILEYCTGGDLAAYIHLHGRVSESVARHFMRQIASGLQVLRENNLIHRDLKPQNLLLCTKDDTPVLKIGDFGFARYLMPQGLADTLCGSPLYMAPEIIQSKKYDAKADLWSVGAILFQLVTGKPPFDGNTQFQLFQNVLASDELQFPQDAMAHLHPDCINLCRSHLRQNPVERLTFEEFFKHKFMTMPRVSESALENAESTKKDNSENSFGGSSKSEEHNMKNEASSQGFLRENTPKVADSFESIEREYVLVHAHFASMETLSSSFEISLRENATDKLLTLTQMNIGMASASLMQSEVAVTAACGSGMGSQMSASSSVLQASTVSHDVTGTSSLNPSSRLKFLCQYVYVLTELAQEKLTAGLHLDSFELVALAVWKEALQVCNFWVSSTTIADSLNSLASDSSHQKDDQSPLNLSEGLDFKNPLSVCSWVERGFILAYNRAEKIFNSLQKSDGDLQMPDAMEMIFQTALSAGKSGGVDELMGHINRALASYSKSITLLMFILMETSSLPLNPPFSLSIVDQQRIHRYITNLRAHLNQSQIVEPHTKQAQDSEYL